MTDKPPAWEYIHLRVPAELAEKIRTLMLMTFFADSEPRGHSTVIDHRDGSRMMWGATMDPDEAASAEHGHYYARWKPDRAEFIERVKARESELSQTADGPPSSPESSAADPAP